MVSVFLEWGDRTSDIITKIVRLPFAPYPGIGLRFCWCMDCCDCEFFTFDEVFYDLTKDRWQIKADLRHGGTRDESLVHFQEMGFCIDKSFREAGGKYPRPKSANDIQQKSMAGLQEDWQATPRWRDYIE